MDHGFVPLSSASPDVVRAHKIIRRTAVAAATEDVESFTDMKLWNTAGASNTTARSIMCTLGDEGCIDFQQKILGLCVKFPHF